MEGDGKAGWLAGLAESLVERGFIIYRRAYTELRVFFDLNNTSKDGFDLTTEAH